jgi:hypothetical protein
VRYQRFERSSSRSAYRPARRPSPRLAPCRPPGHWPSQRTAAMSTLTPPED